MKRFVLVVVLIMTLGLIYSCKDKPAVVDPVKDFEPLTNALWAGEKGDSLLQMHTAKDSAYAESLAFPLDKWYGYADVGNFSRADSLLNIWKHQLTKNVIKYCETDSVKVDSVAFARVKGKVSGVESASGVHDGEVNWQILCHIYYQGESKPKDKFLVCGNGLTSSEFESEVSYGPSLQTRFLVTKGGSVAGLIPEQWESVVENLQIPCTDKKGKIVEVSIKELRKGIVKSQWLFEGDIIDLGREKVFNKAGQQVDFQRRISETQKAHKRSKRRR